MQCIHAHIPEKHHVPMGYIVAALLSLLFMVPLFLVPALTILFFYVSTFRKWTIIIIIIIILLGRMFLLSGVLHQHWDDFLYFTCTTDFPCTMDFPPWCLDYRYISRPPLGQYNPDDTGNIALV
jgi:hypothetical protein